MSKTLQQVANTERCYKCGSELEDGFVTVPGDVDHETGYAGWDDYICSNCSPVSMDESDVPHIEMIGSIVWSPESLKALGIDPEGESDMERARR